MLTLLLCLCGEQCVARRVLLGRRAAGLSAILSTRLAPSCPLARKLSLFPLKALSPLCLSVSPRASWASWGAEAGAEAAPLPKVFGSDGLVERLRTTGRVGADDDLARAYERRPADLSGVQLPPEVFGARDVAVIFHGSGGPDRETSATENALLNSDAAAGFERVVVNFNWMPWFTPDTDRLSFTSQALGRLLGNQLYAAAPLLRSLHVIGTSAGSFAADACASAYIESASSRLLPPSKLARDGLSRAEVRLTLADPFAALEGSDRGVAILGLVCTSPC